MSVFAKRAFDTLGGLAEDEYRMRSLPGAKELVEEIIPLATLIKYLETPNRRVRCRYVGGNQNHDARIRLSGPEIDHGFLEPAYCVEVTSAMSSVEHLRREALTRYGHVFGGPDIERIGSRARGDDRIVSRATAVDGESAVTDLAAWVEDRLKKKSTKGYPQPCILVLDVSPERRLSLTEWASLATRVKPAVDRDAFSYTFIVEWSTNSVFGI